jgi:hypothetical protein
MSWAFMNSHLGVEFEDLKTSVRKTGFEWSLRLTSTSDAPHRSRAPQSPEHLVRGRLGAFRPLGGTSFQHHTSAAE